MKKNLFNDWEIFFEEEQKLGSKSDFWETSDDGFWSGVSTFQAFQFWAQVNDLDVQLTTGAEVPGLVTISMYSGLRLQMSQELMDEFHVWMDRNSYQTITVERGTTEKFMTAAEKKAAEAKAAEELRKAGLAPAEDPVVEQMWQDWKTWATETHCVKNPSTAEAPLDDFRKFLDQYGFIDPITGRETRIKLVCREKSYQDWHDFDPHFLSYYSGEINREAKKANILGIIPGYKRFDGEVGFYATGYLSHYGTVDFDHRIIRKKMTWGK